MHEVTICVATDVVELHQIALPYLRALPPERHLWINARSTICP